MNKYYYDYRVLSTNEVIPGGSFRAESDEKAIECGKTLTVPPGEEITLYREDGKVLRVFLDLK